MLNNQREMNVILVENAPAIADFLRSALGGKGIRIRFATLEGAAPEAARGADAAVVRVSRLNDAAWRLVEALRRIGLPVVVTSNRAEVLEARRAMDLGCAYMPKPFAINQMVETLRRLVPQPQVA